MLDYGVATEFGAGQQADKRTKRDGSGVACRVATEFVAGQG
jgi:hypothetical protein